MRRDSREKRGEGAGDRDGLDSRFIRRIDRDALLISGLFILTVAMRIPFTSRFLTHIDSVQFALALKEYDVTLHQPHPPGYFLYVMAGRLVGLFSDDPNAVFVTISIVFSGLTVVAVYFLARDMFDQRTGIIAAAIALTSPSFWFHGEMALTYAVEAFFSCAEAVACWRLCRGERSYLWPSVVLLGLAGGVRQNTLVFLLPLWMFSVRRQSSKDIWHAIAVLAVVCCLWFVPMVLMTGGFDAYMAAFRELWTFNTGHNSVFDKGLPRLRLFAGLLLSFTWYGLGAAVFALAIGAYALIRRKDMGVFRSRKAVFLLFWVLPSMLFYLLIYLQPTNPGYALIYLPAFFIVAAASLCYVGGVLRSVSARDVAPAITAGIVLVNAAIFFFSWWPVSYNEIRTNDKTLAVMLDGVRRLDPATTAVLGEDYIYFGYRPIMYYAPDFTVYELNFQRSPEGEARRIFGGRGGRSFQVKEILFPKGITTFAVPILPDLREKFSRIQGVRVTDLSCGVSIATGPTALLKVIYPDLKMAAQETR